MTSPFQTPGDLVRSLQHRETQGREHLHAMLRQPLARLLEEMRTRHRLVYDPQTLLLHTLHASETYLRSRPAEQLERMSWQGLRATVLLQAARTLSQPFGQKPNGMSGPLTLPLCTSYESQALYQPYDRVGDYWFGGDWYAGAHAADGALWVIVADVTGHGYHAYLLASMLPDVWARCWERAATDCQPADLLHSMHDELSSCLPEGIYLECTLVRLTLQGEATVVPAGGSRLLLRRQGQQQTELIKLRGTWLGLLPPSREDQHSWALERGDEILLGTDGLFDQLLDLLTPDLASLGARASSLFEHCSDLLRRALEQGKQDDDITMIQLLRRSGSVAEEGSDLLSFSVVRPDEPPS